MPLTCALKIVNFMFCEFYFKKKKSSGIEIAEEKRKRISSVSKQSLGKRISTDLRGTFAEINLFDVDSTCM